MCVNLRLAFYLSLYHSLFLQTEMELEKLFTIWCLSRIPSEISQNIPNILSSIQSFVSILPGISSSFSSFCHSNLFFSFLFPFSPPTSHFCRITFFLAFSFRLKITRSDISPFFLTGFIYLSN